MGTNERRLFFCIRGDSCHSWLTLSLPFSALVGAWAVHSSARAAAPGFQNAVNLVWFSPTVDQRALDATLDNLKAVGVDHVALNVWWFQNNINSTQVAPDFSRYSSTDDTIRQVIDAAHSRNLAVELRPLVDLSADPTHWRGEITGGTTWFNGAGGYGDYVRHMADIAQAKSCEMFGVGVELEATATQSTNWRNLITSVRSRYTGPITYSANWGNPAVGSSINWWDAVDYMGIDAYYPLTGVNNPTPAQLQSAWATRANQIESYRNSVAPGKPVLFTEAGYINQDGANTQPYGNLGTASDQREQFDCYTALLSQNTPKSWFNAVYWWAQDLNPNPNPVDYGPMGKLALDAMAAYYIPGYTIGPNWTGGGGNNWSTAASWSSGAVPGNLTTATFNSPGGGTTSINLGGPVTLARLIFDTPSAAAYTFQSGNTLTFNAGGGITVVDNVTTTQTLNCNVALLGPAIFANGSTAANQLLVVNGNITGAGAGLNRISLINNGNGQLNGAISDGAGTVALFKAGTGTWSITHANTFSGETAILGGNLTIFDSAALGSTVGGTYIANATSLQLTSGMAVSGEPLEMTGIGNGGQGALQLLSGAGTWTGQVTINGSGQFANRSFNGNGFQNFTIGGKITGGSSSGSVTFRGSNSTPGFFRLTGSGSDYLGGTYVWGTKVILAGGTNTLPATTVVDLDSLGRALSLDAGVLDLNGNNQTLAGLINHTSATPTRVVNRATGTTATLALNTTGNFTYSGRLLDDGGQLALAKAGPGAQTLSNSNTYSGGTSVSGGSLNIAHVAALGTGSLSVTGGTVKLSPGFTTAMLLPAVNVTGGGKLDTADNDLVIDYTGSSPLASIAAMLDSGYASGAWNGPGINSSSAAAASGSAVKTAIGFGEASALGLTTFAGRNVDSTAILLRYTVAADGNLDGTVDTLDFNALSANFGGTGKTWISGDWNFDQVVDTLDFNLLAANFGQTVPASGASAALVPEPAAAGIVGIAALLARRRRRRGS
jgi:autotransporter-associated beta strand protein